MTIKASKAEKDRDLTDESQALESNRTDDAWLGDDGDGHSIAAPRLHLGERHQF